MKGGHPGTAYRGEPFVMEKSIIANIKTTGFPERVPLRTNFRVIHNFTFFKA